VIVVAMTTTPPRTDDRSSSPRAGPRRPAKPAAVGLLLALSACGGGGSGGGGGGGSGAPDIAYPETLSLRVGQTTSPVVPQNAGGTATWTVSPPLPPGLSLAPGSGVVTGTPTQATPSADHVFVATNEAGTDQATVTVQVTPALPAGLVSLHAGFAAEVLHGSLSAPVKMALAPDGRLFFNELSTGNVRVVDADGVLLGAPFATLPVLTSGEQGLLGLALAPDFATSGTVVAFASTPAGDGHGARNRVVRWTDSGNVGTAFAVLVDDLPIGNLHNAGDVRFGPDGNLYVTLGDTTQSDLAQTDGSPAGRVLRYTPTGGIPADNPIPGDPEWVRGLRNSFDLAFHPTTGGLFGSENGPTSQDELNFLQAGKNYGWPSLPPGFPGSGVGFRVRAWTPVIAPTGIEWHDGTGFGPEFEDDLFLGAYVDEEVRRLALSGPDRTDLDFEEVFARWNGIGSQHKPLDLLRRPDGSLLVSTFTAIWRFYRYP
jgi:glucose/arabinose dehydrogenase